MVRLALHSIAYEAKTLNLAKAGYTAFYVDGTDGNDVHDGGSWGQAFKTIQHAVDEAGSWCKIFIKAGTYAENVAISDQGIHLIGEKIDTVIIKPSSGKAINSTGNNITIETLTAVGNGTGSSNTAIYGNGKYITIKNTMVGNQNTSGYGVVIGGEYGTCDGILIDQANKPNNGLWFESKYGTIINCVLENVGQDGIVLAETACYWNDVHNNTIIDAGRYGIYLFGLGCDYNTIFHNNIINSTTANVRDTSGNDNKFFENFYDDHTTDTNNDGLCDSAYSFTTGNDYQPVSKRNGWKQWSIGITTGGAGDATIAKQDIIIADTDKILADTSTLFQKTTKTITLSHVSIPMSQKLYEVTGEVECYVVGYIDTTVTSAGALTLEVGNTSDNNGLIPTTAVGNLVAGNIWVDATAGKLRPRPTYVVISDSDDIRHYIDGDDALTGAVTYYCWWRPLSSDGNVVSA